MIPATEQYIKGHDLLVESAGRKGAWNASPTLTATTCLEAALADDSLSTIEEWRPVVGFPDYQVSDRGRVKSIARMIIRGGRLARVFEKILAGYLKHSHYGRPIAMVVTLKRDGRRHYERVHRLVLEAFVGPCPDGKEGCHDNGNPSNNGLNNLRWGTRDDNLEDMKRHGTRHPVPHYRGEESSVSKLTEAQVRRIRAIKVWPFGLQAQLARETGISATHVRRIRNGHGWEHIK